MRGRALGPAAVVRAAQEGTAGPGRVERSDGRAAVTTAWLGWLRRAEPALTA
jgi:hypothetical protein